MLTDANSAPAGSLLVHTMDLRATAAKLTDAATAWRARGQTKLANAGNRRIHGSPKRASAGNRVKSGLP
jgi:hypothetical protein